MKKYILILTSLVVLIIFGLTGFIKVVKLDQVEGKKISHKANPAKALGLYTKPVSSEFEDLYPQHSTKLDKAQKEQFLKNIAQLPLMFQKNMGQWTNDALYCATTATASVAFRKDGLSFISYRELEEHDEDDEEEEDGGEEHEIRESMVWNLNFKGMNNNTQVVAEGEVPGVTSYLKGNDSTKWVRNAPESRLINYKGIYNNIDLYYYGIENHKLEYDYIVKPGGNIISIKMELDGADDLKINNKGELIITTSWGNVTEDKPYSYQVINGIKKEVDIRYNILDDKTFGFKAYDSYDTGYDLVIDPKTMIWTSYTKNITSADDYVHDIAIDANRNSYITGWAETNFTTTSGVIQTTTQGSTDAFVAKFNRTGTILVYSTFLGSDGEDRGKSIAVTSDGHAFVTGFVKGSGFPTTPSTYPPIYSAPRSSEDTFISALNLTGTGFTYSTYYGSTCCDDFGNGIFVNNAGETYVTGTTRRGGFPAPPTSTVKTGPLSGSDNDAFVLKLDGTGQVIFSTFLGGTGYESGNGIYVSSSNEIYVTGETTSTDFTTSGVVDNSSNGGRDAFVAKLNSDATSYVYSTYLGGTNIDVGYNIFVLNDAAYVTGTTTSTSFTTSSTMPGGFRTSLNGTASDVFVAKINAAGSALVYFTFLGGTSDEGLVDTDRESDIAVNNNGEAYVTGVTSSTDMPFGALVAINKYEDTYQGGSDDGFIALLNSAGSNLLCATYIGGTNADYKKTSIALDLSSTAQDTLYGSITTHSKSTVQAGTMPMVQSQGAVYLDQHLNGGDEHYVFKMSSCSVPPLPVTLISFAGSNKGDHNFLEWATATEINNDYFNIERSIDGINFVAIGTVDGAGNSGSLLNYSYSDQKEGEEIIYYRLKQVDIDGKTSYSKVVVINAPDANKALQLTITSPVTDHLNYKVCCLQKGDAKVEITDMSGKVVLSNNVHVNEGYNKLTFDAKGLAEGLYILKFTSINGTVSTKFVK